MNNSRRRALAIRFVLSCAAALAVAAPGHAMPRSVMAAIEATAPPNPEHIPLKVGDFGSAIALGLIVGPGATAGELAGSAEASGKDPKLSERLAGQKLLIGDALAQAMVGALKKRGFNAFSKGGAAQPQPPTARLELIIEEAGYERRVWGKIGPKLTVRVRVYEAASNDRVFADTYKYDMSAQTIGWTMLRPPEEFGFDEPEEVLAHPEVVVAGLRKGIEMIAERAAEDIVGEMED